MLAAAAAELTTCHGSFLIRFTRPLNFSSRAHPTTVDARFPDVKSIPRFRSARVVCTPKGADRNCSFARTEAELLRTLDFLVAMSCLRELAGHASARELELVCFPVLVAETLQREIVDNDADGHGWVRQTHLPQRPDQQQLKERCCKSAPWDDSALLSAHHLPHRHAQHAWPPGEAAGAASAVAPGSASISFWYAT